MYMVVWREGFSSNSFSIYCPFYSLAMKGIQEYVRREEKSPLESLASITRKIIVVKLKMQIKLCADSTHACAHMLVCVSTCRAMSVYSWASVYKFKETVNSIA